MLTRATTRFVALLVVLLASGLSSTLTPAAAPQIAAETPPPAGQSVPEFMKWYQAQPRVSLPVPAEGAAVLVIKFTDLECPACGLTHEAYKPVFAKYQAQAPGALRMVTKDFPLNKDCNPQMPYTMHEAACEAAIAVRLARRNGRADDLENWLYANQSVLTPATVVKAASLVASVSPADFDSGRARIVESIKQDVAMARSLNITSTPTFVINGVKVSKVMEPALFDAVVAYELRRAGKIK